MGLVLPDDLAPPPVGVFRPTAQYSRVGDLLKVYLEDDRAYAVQLTPEITVLRAFSDHRIVGVKVGNVAAKLHGLGG